MPAKSISVLSWNIETFFDGQNDGSEYSEFLKSKSWGTKAYGARVKKLCDSLKVLDSDVCVLIELENQGVLYDISNGLQDLNWNRNKLYRFSCFSKNDGAGIGLGVLTRYEILRFSVHNIDVKNCGDQPSLRPVMKIHIDVDGRELILFVNHWKSMSGGKEKSEVWRNWQESIVYSLVNSELEDGKKNILIAGDFNRDIADFYRSESTSVAGRIGLRHFLNDGKTFDDTVDVTSAWYDRLGFLVSPGSYCFNSQWSRIDQIFYAGEIELKSFSAVQNELWCTDDGIPDSYDVYTGKGSSDHLPLKCVVDLKT